MTWSGSSHEALITGATFMAQIGAFFPVSLELRGGELDCVLMMRAGDLGHRTVGPYSPDHMPVDVMTWADLRTGIGMAGHVPRFSVDASGLWPRLHVELLGTAIRGLVVMPEEVTAESVNAPYLGPWQDSTSSSVRIALDWIAERLARCHHHAGGAEPSIDLTLAHRPDDGYQARLAAYPVQVRDLLSPVRTVLDVRWRSATQAQRRAFVTDLDGAERIGGRSDRRLRRRIAAVEVELPD